MIAEEELNSIDSDIAASPEILGAECQSCSRLLAWKYFRKMSSRATGHSPQCLDCEASPRLSMEEHLSRLREKNLNSHAVKAQRHEDQDDFRYTHARKGTRMHTSELLLRLHKLVPELYVTEGGIVGDIALYLTSPGTRADWEGKNYKYLGYVHFGTLPEFSTFSFDDVRDVMIREEERGWRTVLLQFLQAGVLTEKQCDQAFGKPSLGIASNVWYKRLHQMRHDRATPQTEQ